LNRLLSVAHILGALLMVFTAAFVPPVAWAIVQKDVTLNAFLVAGAITFLAGLVCWLPTRRFKRELQPRDGCLLVVLCWVLMASVATIPLMLSIKDLSFTDAFFETMSGLTTTGSTVLSGLDTLPQPINLWRHILNWYGGMGIIVLAVAVLPLLGVGGMQLFKAETPGPMKEGKLTPRITQTAKYLWILYAGITVLCTICLMIAGMSFYEAICHAFSAMALGGFSTRDASVGGFDSLAIEIVLQVFMMIAVLNFATHFTAFRARSLRPYFRCPEAVWVLLSILGSCVFLGWYLWWMGIYPDFWLALRHASFNTISIATSSGYMTQDFDKWPIFAPMWMYLLCTVASSSGSTGGGIKMIRTIILLRQSTRELLRMMHPRAINPMILGGQIVDNKVILAVMGFMLLYGLTVGGLTLIMLFTGLDFITSLTAVIATVNNTGPGLGLVGPTQNYSVLSDFQTWLCSFAMLAGRLELLTVFILFMPRFWSK
jgi:trk system potassium uptake protein